MQQKILNIALCAGLGITMIHVGVISSWVLIFPGMGFCGYAGWTFADLIREVLIARYERS